MLLFDGLKDSLVLKRGGKHGKFYKMTDEYSLFYFRWLEPIKEALLEENKRAGYWDQMLSSHAWYSWAGYSFESICYKHIGQIRSALNLSATVLAYSWRYVPKKDSKERGAQIDLLFDRNDQSISLCEIKYSRKPNILAKTAAEKLKRQVAVFKKQTKTKKTVFICFVTAKGLKKTIYSEEFVSGVVTLRDLFKDLNA